MDYTLRCPADWNTLLKGRSGGSTFISSLSGLIFEPLAAANVIGSIVLSSMRSPNEIIAAVVRLSELCDLMALGFSPDEIRATFEDYLKSIR